MPPPVADGAADGVVATAAEALEVTLMTDHLAPNRSGTPDDQAPVMSLAESGTTCQTPPMPLPAVDSGFAPSKR